jgi:hypothetical protein
VSLDALIVFAGITGVGYVIASRRRGNVHKHVIGSSQIVVETAAEPRAAFDAITHIGAPYRVDDTDAERLRIVLSKSPTVWTAGWFFPIEIAAEEGGSRITIGIRSRLLFGGALPMLHAHKRCANAIRALFAMPEMRVT